MKTVETIVGTMDTGMITTLDIGTAIEDIGPTAITGTNLFELARSP